MENKPLYTSDEISIIIAAGGINRFGEFENFINKDGAVFIPGLEITGSLILTQNFNSPKKDIIFSNCTFNDEVGIYQHPYVSPFHFKECIFEKSVSFHQLRTTVALSNNCHFKSDLTINGSGDTICNISDIIIDELFTISGGYPNNFSLSNINLNKEKSEKKGRLKFSQAHFKNLEAKNITLLSILCDNTVFDTIATFKAVAVNEFTIATGKANGIFNIIESNVDKLYLLVYKGAFNITNSNINECMVYFEKSKLTVISGCVLNKLNLNGTIEKESIFNFLDSNVFDLEFESVTNEGELTLTDINIPENGKLSIQSSNLGKADFKNCRFSQAILEFENSKIFEVFIVDTDFPRYVKVNNEFNYVQAQLVFGQLHTLLLKQGDTVRALEYQAREIEAHYKILKHKSYVVSNVGRLYKSMQIAGGKLLSIKPFNILYKRLSLILNKVWSEVRLVANIFSLWLNNISNNFGRSWQRGVLFSLGIGALFFYLLVIGSNEYSFGFSIDINGILIKSYLKFMNPIRFFELEYLFKDKNNPNSTYLTLDSTWCFVWDFLGRVFVAYGYYQTIQAFRRLGRK